eukprot:jgi/Botrbrau1/19230/Bobra.0077s0127.1
MPQKMTLGSPWNILEERYNEWLASKKAAWDRLIFALSICYVLAYVASDNRPCSQSFWIFALGVVITCFAGLYLSLWRPLAYAKARPALLTAMWYFVPATTWDTHVVLERALRNDKQPLAAFLLIAAVKLPIMVQLFCTVRVKIAWSPMVHLVGALIFYVGSLRGAAVYKGSVSKQPWVQFLTAAFNAVLHTFMGEVPGACFEGGSLPILSTLESLMILWLVLQGATFAAGFAYQACAEKRDRQSFLDEAGLRIDIPTAHVGDLAARLAAVYVFASLWMIANVHHMGVLPASSCH